LLVASANELQVNDIAMEAMEIAVCELQQRRRYGYARQNQRAAAV
jgi:hypothetical protein